MPVRPFVPGERGELLVPRLLALWLWLPWLFGSLCLGRYDSRSRGRAWILALSQDWEHEIQLWCAKNAIYIQLWPLGTIKVEKSKKGTVKKLRPKNRLGSTLEAHFPALIS